MIHTALCRFLFANPKRTWFSWEVRNPHQNGIYVDLGKYGRIFEE
mgnify:CR=1 FL=1